jgi:hypothetical protein
MSEKAKRGIGVSGNQDMGIRIAGNQGGWDLLFIIDWLSAGFASSAINYEKQNNRRPMAGSSKL